MPPSRLGVVVFGTALLVLTGCGAPTGLVPPGAADSSAGMSFGALSHAGRDRTWCQYTPAGAVDGAPHPLILLLHGSGGSGQASVAGDGWEGVAEEYGCVIVAPDALPLDAGRPPNWLSNPRMWSAGQPERAGAADDVDFVRVLLDELERRGIAVEQLFIAGHSSGGSLAFAAAAALGARVAGLAVVAAACWVDAAPLAAPVPTLYIVGSADPLVPLEGGPVDLLWLHRTMPPVMTTLTRWASVLGCDGALVELPSAGGLWRFVPSRCHETVRFEAVIVEGQGHGWPGGHTPALPKFVIGPATRGFDATSAIAEFLFGSQGEVGAARSPGRR